MKRKIIAIVPAAGVGARAGTGPPKQYRPIGTQAMLRRSVLAVLADARVEQLRVAVAPGDTRVTSALAGLPRTVWRACGGPTRADTVLAALDDAHAQGDLSAQDWVLVHDAARPGLPPEALARLIDTCLRERAGGLLALPVADSVKRGEDGAMAARVVASVAREGLWLAQTPQMFPAGALRAALAAAAAAGQPVTDEAAAMASTGCQPLLVQGSVRNFKVTWPEDFALMARWLD